MMQQLVNDYVMVRRSTGFSFRTEETMLRGFASFAAGCGDRFIRTRTAIAWASLARSAGQRGRRLGYLRSFARFAIGLDVRHELPPPQVFGRPPGRRAPFILSDQQIADILIAAKWIPPVDSLRPKVFVTLFGLLAVTGLRVSEATALRLDDVTPDGLLVRETKFHKSRLVPLHRSTEEALGRYIDARSRERTSDSALFMAWRTRRRMTPASARQAFSKIVRELGIKRPSSHGRERPRLHDLRHTFTVRSLEQACTDVRSVAEHTVALSTYLGHVDFRSTYWYLEGTPQLLKIIGGACEAYFRRGAR